MPALGELVTWRQYLYERGKTGQRRNVRLLAPLAEDLREWNRTAGKPDEAELVSPSASGERWTEEAYKSWASRAPRGRKGQDGRRRAAAVR